jgi:hypothetical protein
MAVPVVKALRSVVFTAISLGVRSGFSKSVFRERRSSVA